MGGGLQCMYLDSENQIITKFIFHFENNILLNLIDNKVGVKKDIF